MTHPIPPGEPLPAALCAADWLLAGATAALLFLAPAAGSAGLRGAMLAIAAGALAWSRGALLARDLHEMPRPVVLACCAWAALASLSVLWSIAPAFSLAELRPEVGYGLAAFAIFFSAARTLARWRLWWLAIVAGSLCVFAMQLLQDLGGIRISRHPMDGGPGPWSTHLVLVAPLLLAIAWPRPWGFDRGASAKAAALLLLLAAAAVTANRIVWAAFATQLAILAVVSRFLPAMDAALGARLRRLTAFATIAVVAGFAISVAEKSAVHYRSDPSVTASIDRDLRPKLWAVARREFAHAPWVGHGFGREILEEKFLAVTPKGIGHPPMRHSHNVFADVALQLGAAGLAIFVAMLAALGWEYRGYLRDQRLAPIGVIGLALVGGFVVKNLTDDFFYRHNALVFWAMNGMLIGFGRSTAPLR
ncbi:MAG: O-antigen ligase family protein [Usitatibacter sp.]